MTEDQKKRVLELRGKKSFALIASELGVSRNTIAGFFGRNPDPNQEPGTRRKYPEQFKRQRESTA